MGKDHRRVLTASEIGDYVFCPRSRALKKLGYKNDNIYELKQGTAFHHEVGNLIYTEDKNAIQEKQNHNNQEKIQFLSILVFFAIIIILSIIGRLLLYLF